MSLQGRWNEVCSQTIGTDQFWKLSVDHRSARFALGPMIAQSARGIVLDAGAGRLAWRTALKRQATKYLATDYSKDHPDIDFVCDLTAGIPLETGSIDTVFCCSVLEHVENPFAALDELTRVLRPGGAMILSVPFRYYLHGAPVDYYRFTRYGVELLARRAGLEVERIETGGGLAHEMANALSMAVASFTGTGRAGIAVASATSLVLWHVAGLIDKADRNGRFAQTVNAVLRKPLRTKIG